MARSTLAILCCALLLAPWGCDGDDSNDRSNQSSDEAFVRAGPIR